jgi:hypothetical protein
MPTCFVVHVSAFWPAGLASESLASCVVRVTVLPCVQFLQKEEGKHSDISALQQKHAMPQLESC